MNYISTRSGLTGPKLNFKETTLNGLADDGGLYLPEIWPRFSEGELSRLAELDYAQLASAVLAKFSGNTLTSAQLDTLCADAYANFDADETAPLIALEDNIHVLELFRGPTLAFKDFALQILGRLFETFLAEDDRRCVIVGATSGDTGSAAIEAVRGQERITLVMLHPDGRVSEVQRKQMTTVNEDNIINLAVDGTFDDCQNFVKALFADNEARSELQLTAVNSINWARVAGQVVFYIYAALRAGAPQREVAFSVPTGNFGNILAGYIAEKMGLPVKKLIIGSNSNDILTRFSETGVMETKSAIATSSPSMDIQVSSNFERLLFELMDRDSDRVCALQSSLTKQGNYRLDNDTMARFSHYFEAYRYDDGQTKDTIANTFKQHGYVLDPHSAIGVAAARQCSLASSDVPIIALATAAPAKFGDIVEAATGQPAPIPERLRDTLSEREYYRKISNDFNTIRAAVFEAHRQRGQ